MIIYFDGGCKPNPGAMELGVLSDDGSIRYHERIGHGTNNEAEWMGLITVLTIAKERGLSRIHVRGDSTLVINQATGKWQVKTPTLKPFKVAYDELAQDFEDIVLEYVRRGKNLAGHFIEEMN